MLTTVPSLPKIQIVPVVTDEHGVALEANRVELGKTAADVETVVGLNRDEDDRHIQLAHKRHEARTRRIRHHVHKEQVEVGHFHRGNHRLRGGRVVAHSEARHLHLVRREFADERLLFLHHVGEKAGTLLPVGAEADGDDTDIGSQRLASRNAQGGIGRDGCE